MGLLETTVVKEVVPLLVPIKLLRQLEAIIDLPNMLWGKRALPMQQLPSGHVTVDVLNFGPGKFTVGSEAKGSGLSCKAVSTTGCRCFGFDTSLVNEKG